VISFKLEKTVFVAFSRSLFLMQKWATEHIVALTSKDRHRANQTMTVNEKESPCFAFLRISFSTHLAHLQSRSSHPTCRALQKSQISLPAELNYI